MKQLSRRLAVAIGPVLVLLAIVAIPAQAVAPTGGDPIGAFDMIERRGSQILVSGWAWDPDTADPVDVRFYVDGVGVGQDAADRPRPDVASAVPGAGSNRGWTNSSFLTATAPQVTVCAYALNVGAGTQNTTLGCKRAAEVDRGTPFGSFDEARILPGGGVLFRGWAIDPDAFGLRVRPTFPDGTSWVDDYRPSSEIFRTQRVPRPDVDRVFTDWTDRKGWEYAIYGYTLDGERVCLLVSDGAVTAEPSVGLGCTTISRPPNPFGALDSAVRAPTSSRPDRVVLRGWALDYDTTSSLLVHLRVVGRSATVVTTADASRGDVSAAYPAYAGPHGYEAAIDVPSGQRVCAYAINVGLGSQNTTLGCLTP